MTDETILALEKKWNHRYSKSIDAGKPCWVLYQHQHLLMREGQSLDLACGLGANALLLAQRGLESYSWDISQEALNKVSTFAQQQQLTVHTQHRDVENNPPSPNSFDVIVVSQFLCRRIMPVLISALKPQGLLFYQTFHQKKHCAHGPSNNEFLLKPNELLSLLSPLKLVFYREDSDIGQPDKGLRDCSYFIGQKNPL